MFVFFFTECITVKYGPRVLEKRGWHEIRMSLNQKCLDKLKVQKRKEEQAAKDKKLREATTGQTNE